MRIFLFFGSIILSCVVLLTSFTDVRAEPQDTNVQAVALSPIESPESIVEKQLRAFREREAGEAYSYASDHLKEKYNDADHFLMMMRFTVQPLTAHVSYTMLESSPIGEGLVQKVEMLNKDGSKVLILYKLIKNAKGQWAVDGYTLLDNEAQPI